MYILSLVSFGNFIVFFMLCVYTIKLSPYKSKLNLYSFFVCLSLGLWNLFFTFFYGNTDRDTAWIYYKLATIGMYAFPAFTLRFFLVLTKKEKLLDSAFKKIVFYMPSVLLTIYTFLAKSTPLADDIELSKLGLGWTYVNRADKFSFWITFIFLMCYLGCSLYILYYWGKKSIYKIEKKQAHLFLFTDSVVLILGVITDFILPVMTRSNIPPMANIFTNIFILFFYYIIRELNVFNINQIASSEQIIETLLEPVIVIDDNNVISQTNTATEQVFGLSAKLIQGKKLSDIFPDNIEIQEKKHGEAVINNTPNGIIYTIFSKNIVRDQLDGYLGAVIHFKDITGIKKEESKLRVINKKYATAAEKLERLANYDTLTGIPNRRMFLRIISDRMKNTDDNRNDFGLIFMDFNGFKDVNDRFGHDIGDQVLVETAKRLKTLEKTNDMTARLGGDEFVMLVGFEKKEEIYERSQNIQSVIAEPIHVDGETCQISAATGISIYSENSHNIKDMLHAADLAMYEHKKYQKRHKDILSEVK